MGTSERSTTLPIESDSSLDSSETTPTATSFMSNSPDYKNLMTSIKNSIDKNDNLFKVIQKANYPSAETYASELLNYKINTQITDLTKARTDIWSFLTKKYNENSKLRIFYFNEIRKIDNHIRDLTSQKRELIDIMEGNSIKTSTMIKSIKNEKYNYNKMEYYLFLYKILVFVQIAILAIITLCITDIIPKNTCLIITIIILIATVAFVAYYVFFINIGRNKFSWSKFEHDNNSISTLPTSAEAGLAKAKAKAEMESKINDMINQSKTKPSGSCST
jgi:hypothetical protein